MYNNSDQCQEISMGSSSKHDPPGQHSTSLEQLTRDRSSCSSLTSGIGQSDHSISGTGAMIEPATGHDSAAFSNFLQCEENNEPNGRNVDGRFTSAYDDTSRNSDIDIKDFVNIIFTRSESIALEQKANFGRLMRTPEARLLFAKCVNDYRVNSKRVSELTFYSLAQYFSIVLLECLLAEDFQPAKIIMNMMFTYYYEQSLDKIPACDHSAAEADQSHYSVMYSSSSEDEKIDDDDDDEGDGNYNNEEDANYDSGNKCDGSGGGKEAKGSQTRKKVPRNRTVKTYLYTLLKDQEIFKSSRFWTSAFYETVLIERKNHPVFQDRNRGFKVSNEKREDEMDCSKNITFGLLASFIHNMCLLGLSQEFCEAFLDKHSTIASLSESQFEMLRSNLKFMFNDPRPAPPAKIGGRIHTFLRGVRDRFNRSHN